MRVEIWSDLICPWCGLGEHRLQAALAAFAPRQHVELVHRSFQLDPGFPAGETMPVVELLVTKKGLARRQVAELTARVEQLAAADGLSPYHVGDNAVGNTRLAHELLAFATSRGLGEAAWRHLYRAYFGGRRSIFDVDSLVTLATECGLDGDEARAVLAERRCRAAVDDDLRTAARLGVTGVPFVVIDRRVAVSGAQDTAVFAAALRQCWEEQPTPLAAAAGDDVSCGPDGCAV